jgi:hypothetical protein
MGEKRYAHRILMGKHVGKRPAGSPKHIWEDNTKMDLNGINVGLRLDSCGSGQGQVAGSCEQGNEPSGSVKYGEFHNYLRNY